MTELNSQQKVDLVRYRHEDQVRLLGDISHNSLKIFSGFITLQLAVGSFLTQVAITAGARWGFILLEFTLCSICSGMLVNNQRRRKEAARTVQNCNAFLGFDQAGAYLPDRALNAQSRFWPWLWFYIAGVWMFFIGILLILIFAEIHPREKNTIKSSINKNSEASITAPLPQYKKLIIKHIFLQNNNNL